MTATLSSVESSETGITTFSLTPGKSNDTIITDPLLAVGTTGDFRIHEVGL